VAAGGPVTITATSEGQSGSSAVTVVPVTGPMVLVGAGDIAECGIANNKDEATALLLDAIPGTVFTAGDNAYENGSASDYANCYEPSWGRHKARTRPAVGNHEYNTSGAAPYYAYFGASAGPASLGYYSYDLGDWHVVVLNSNISRGATSAQVTWLKADLAQSTKPCQVAIFHHPQWTNNPTRSDNQYGTRPFWDALWTAGVDLVINGHDHHYVRWAPQTPKGGPDPTGIRQITVGTGGRTDLYDLSSQPRATVEARNNNTFGVLELTLRSDAYDWRFVPIAGQTFTDEGTGSCFVGQRPPPPNQLPVARPGGPYQSQGLVAFDGRASSDPDGDNPLTYHWEFGDGLSGTGAQTTHTYAPGTYTATLRVTDNLGGESAPATTTVTITNLAPTVNAGPDIAIGLGQPFHLQAGIGDAATDGPWTYVITWGDGATETGSVATQGAAAISATHVYAAAGSFNALVTVTDKHGATGSDAITAVVTELPPATIVHTLLTAANNAGNLQVYSTAAIAPGPNALITVAVLGYSTLATPPIPALSGGGMSTWSMVSTVTFDGAPASRRLTVFRAMSAQPGNGPLTIVSTGVTLSNMQWIVSQWDGVDVSGVNGAGAVLQAGSTSGAAVNGLTVNLNDFGHPNNVAFGVFGVKKNAVAVTPGLGFTEISEVPSAENSDGDLQAEWAKNLPAIGATWTSLTAGAIGIEIKVRP
jgi:PKD domain-containing protein/calcineurin-like phosphoesterase family protein